MKKSIVLTATLIFSLYLTGCAKNDTRSDLVNRDTIPNDVGTDTSRMRVAERAADKVTDLKEVDSAIVIVSYNNAYVAAKLEPGAGNRLSTDVKNKIAKAVKSVDRNIDNVYVSTNPDFYDRMKTYAQDIRNGKPISGLFYQFTDTIRRIFPEAK